MRIAFFADNFYPELSGIVDSILITGKELKKRGHDICYVGPRYAIENYALAKRQLPATGEEILFGMKVIRLPSIHLPGSPTGQSRLSGPTGHSIAALAEWKPDIIHTNSPWGVGLEAAKVAKALQLPLIGTNHTAVEDFFPMTPLVRRYDAWYYNKCAFVTAPYQTLLTNMQTMGLKSPSRAVANPAELPIFIPVSVGEKQKLKERFGFKGPVVIYCGRLGKEKRVDVVLSGVALVIKKIPELQMVVTGHGSEGNNLRALAKHLGIEKNVRFTDFLPLDELAHYYQASDVFAFMSTSDSQSLALMQAYAVGIPAVCARARGLPDYCPPQCGFLVEPGDYAAMADKITELLTNEALRSQMGSAAIQFVQQFTPAHIANTWEEIYKGVLTK